MEVLDDMKKLMMIAVALIGALTGFADSAEMKLMSFNVLHCAGMDGKLDIARTAGRIRAEDPDFACLQEIDWRTARVNGIDEPAELARLTGLHATFAKAIFFAGGRAAAGIAEGCEGRPVREGDRGDGRSCPFHRGSVSREGGIRPSDRAGGHRGVGLDRNGALLCA